MKLPAFLILLSLPASAAVIWQENFESYDTSKTSLEDQNPAWWTDPVGTDSIAVVANSSLNGSKSLVVGRSAPVGETDPGVSWALGPESTEFTPAPPEVELRFSVTLAFGAGPGQTALQDNFLLSFSDQAAKPLSNIMFAPGLVAGDISVYRGNFAPAGQTGTFDTQTIIGVGDSFTLDVVMNLLLNKWTATVSTGSNVFGLFANVDMTRNPDATAQNLGAFNLDWQKAAGATQWGSNFMVADNFVMQSQVPVPEPGVPMLAAVCAMIGVLRRRR